jgi:hypothetical protein
MAVLAEHGAAPLDIASRARHALITRRQLQIRQMAGPVILNRACQICAIVRRGVGEIDRAAWVYMSCPDGGGGCLLTVCDYHLARAVRTYALPAAVAAPKAAP